MSLPKNIIDALDAIPLKELENYLAGRKTRQITGLKCVDCTYWIGRCTKGKANRVACDPACFEILGKGLAQKLLEAHQ